MEPWLIFGIASFVSYGISTVIDKHLMGQAFAPLPTNMQKMLFDGVIVLVLGTIFLSPSLSTTILFHAVLLGGVYALSGVVYFEMLEEKDVEQAVPVRQAGVTLFSFIGAVFLFEEAATLAQYAGVVVVVTGMYLLLSSDSLSLPSWDHGLSLIVLSMAINVLYWLLVKVFIGSSTPVALAIAMYFVTAVLLALYLRLTERENPVVYFKDRGRLWRIGVTSVFGGTGTFFFYLALAAGNGSQVYPLAGIQSLVIFLLATTFLDEPFTRYRGIGLVGVIAGVALVSL
jgi:uncharacterized membrane protein